MQEAREGPRRAAPLSALPFVPVLSSHPGGVNSDTAWTSCCGCSVAQLCPTLCDPMGCNHLTLCLPLLLLLSIFPSIRVFSNESVLHIRWPSIGASVSVSVLPMNIQGWFPLWSTGLISFLSKGLSRVFPNTIVQKHQFFGTQFSLQSNSHIHTWLLDLCWQSENSSV